MSASLYDLLGRGSESLKSVLEQSDKFVVRSELVRDLVVQTKVEEIKSVLAKKEQRPIVWVRAVLTQEQQQKLITDFDCYYKLDFTRATDRDAHAFAREHRRLTRRFVFEHIFQYSERQRVPANFDMHVKDVGANPVTHIVEKRTKVHACSPILCSNDSVRHSAYIRFLSNEQVDDTKKKILERHRNGDPKYICHSKSQYCSIKAKNLLFLHSTYDMSVKDIAFSMAMARAELGVAVVIFHPDVLIYSEGYISDQEMFFRKYRNSRGVLMIDMWFKNDVQNGYRHRFDVYMSLLRAQRVSVNLEGIDYHYDIVCKYNKSSVRIIELSLVVALTVPESRPYRMLFSGDVDEKIVIYGWDFMTADNDGWHSEKMHRIRMVVPKRLVERAISYFHTLRDGRRLPSYLLTAMVSFNTRETLNGQTFGLKEPISAILLQTLAYNIFHMCWIWTYEKTQMLKELQKDESAFRSRGWLGRFLNRLNPLNDSTSDDIRNCDRKFAQENFSLENSSRPIWCIRFLNWLSRGDRRKYPIYSRSIAHLDCLRVDEELELIEQVRNQHAYTIMEEIVSKDENLFPTSQMQTFFKDQFPISTSEEKKEKFESDSRTEINLTETDVETRISDCQKSCVIVNTPGDGLCGFHALKGVGATMDDPEEIRSRLRSSKFLAPFLEFEPEVIDSLKAGAVDMSSWASDSTMKLFALEYGVKICMHIDDAGESSRIEVGAKDDPKFCIHFSGNHWSALREEIALDPIPIETVSLESKVEEELCSDSCLKANLVHREKMCMEGVTRSQWTKARGLVNELEKLPRGDYVSRSALKLKEIFHRIPDIRPKNGDVCIDVCAGPGGFTQVLLEYPINHVYGITHSQLIRYDPDIQDSRLEILKVLVPGVFEDGGDICCNEINAALCELINERHKAGVDLIVSDGAVCENDGPMDMKSYMTLKKSEILIALTCIRIGGNYILKCNRCVENFNMQIFSTLSYSFRKVTLISLSTSRVTSGEYFVVCEDYEGISLEITRRLCGSTSENKNFPIAREAKQKFETFSNTIVPMQLDALSRTQYFLKNMDEKKYVHNDEIVERYAKVLNLKRKGGSNGKSRILLKTVGTKGERLFTFYKNIPNEHISTEELERQMKEYGLGIGSVIKRSLCKIVKKIDSFVEEALCDKEIGVVHTERDNIYVPLRKEIFRQHDFETNENKIFDRLELNRTKPVESEKPTEKPSFVEEQKDKNHKMVDLIIVALVDHQNSIINLPIRTTSQFEIDRDLVHGKSKIYLGEDYHLLVSSCVQGNGNVDSDLLIKHIVDNGNDMKSLGLKTVRLYLKDDWLDLAELPASEDFRFEIRELESGLSYVDAMNEFLVYQKAVIKVEKSNHERIYGHIKTNSRLRDFLVNEGGNFGYLRYGNWMIKPREIKKEYRSIFVKSEIGFEFVPFSRAKEFEVALVSDYCEKQLEDMIIESCESIEISDDIINSVDIEFVQAAPGSGKTTYILQNHVPLNDKNNRKPSLVLLSTIEGKEDFRDRVQKFTKTPLGPDSKIRYRTALSYLINGGGESDSLYIDESLMHHPGMIFYIISRCQPKKVVLVGDRFQIPFVNRVRSMKLNCGNLLDFVRVSRTLNCSYRCPLDVCKRLSQIYKGLEGTSDVVRSVDVKRISSINSVPKLPNAHYLVWTQSEKQELLNYVGKSVSTIHEFQGKEHDHIVLVRLSPREQDEIYKREAYTLVALSRAKKQTSYYTMFDRDLASAWIREMKNFDDNSILDIKRERKGGSMLVYQSGEPISSAKICRTSIKNTMLPIFTFDRLSGIRKSSSGVNVGLNGMMTLTAVRKASSLELRGKFAIDASILSIFDENQLTYVLRKSFPNCSFVFYGSADVIPYQIFDFMCHNGLSGIPNRKFVKEEDDVEDDQEEKIENFEDVNIADLQLILDHCLPNTMYAKRDLDLWMIHNSDLEICPGNLSYRRTPIYTAPEYDFMEPVVCSAAPTVRSITARESLIAFNKRNGCVPQLSDISDFSVESNRLLESFCTLLDQEKLKDVVTEEIRVTEVELAAWLKKQPIFVAEQIIPEVPLNSDSVDSYEFSIKPHAKPNLTVDAVTEHSALQTIVYHPKHINAMFCVIFRELKERILYSLKNHFKIFCDKSPENFRRELNRDVPVGSIHPLMDKVEVDISKYDKSQREVALEFECKLMRFFGVPEEWVSLWYNGHIVTDIGSRATGLRAVINYQRKSGDASTFLGNTTFLMGVLSSEVDMSTVQLGVFSGDDSLLIGYGIRDQLDTSRMASLYNLECKKYEFEYSYFCSKFLLVNGDEWEFIPDPLKLCVKLGRTDLKNPEHVEEYRVSFSDNVKRYSDDNVCRIVSEALRERYRCSIDLSSQLRQLYICSGINNFNKLYYMRPGGVYIRDVKFTDF